MSGRPRAPKSASDVGTTASIPAQGLTVGSATGGASTLAASVTRGEVGAAPIRGARSVVTAVWGRTDATPAACSSPT